MTPLVILNMPPLRLAVIRHVGSYAEVGPAFDRILAWATGRGMAHPTAVGVYYDNPAEVPVAALRADAGVVVPAEMTGVDEVGIVTLAAGRYARMSHRGPYTQLGQAYEWFYRDWLPASGESLACGPAYEIYRNSPREVPQQELLTDIHMPLAG
ncbi:GyrI-like domain-containing protein [Chelatococcus sp. SYSU_G07232]|uniref:GyrI-like domain-containing protein n=1 Tax=Chelatococcus albus TaxID=3047466 RepID=A0ABT7AGK1_9HYPH|nr:GyrI-like domain-containing protein [Chelatococcus sp. SYSU_G07232]MDJ1158492.1 GyrI-like domain-containing protein [Chelatococcus sp. SYSU_G07232]